MRKLSIEDVKKMVDEIGTSPEKIKMWKETIEPIQHIMDYTSTLLPPHNWSKEDKKEICKQIKILENIYKGLK